MNIREQKIINGIKYFVKNTRNVGRTKLFKLLYYWDFIHFSKHAQSVTGYEYYTFPFGPVPKEFYEQIVGDCLPKSFEINFSIIEDDKIDEADEYKRFRIYLKDNKIDWDYLTPYEKKSLEEVAFIFKEATASQMTKCTHLDTEPWSKTVKEKGYDKTIDYLLAVNKDTPFDEEEIKERFKLQKEMFHNGYN